ncbi:MAG: hypothetical protein C4583_06645 [Anaerolineaceae bacterium]|nr:MAG: hypothetical protein C4583_06645 [Anaerolineaceae bacterium]
MEGSLSNCPRYENPYSQTDFNADEIKISDGEHELIIKPVDWNSAKAADKDQFGKFFQKRLENGV